MTMIVLIPSSRNFLTKQCQMRHKMKRPRQTIRINVYSPNDDNGGLLLLHNAGGNLNNFRQELPVSSRTTHTANLLLLKKGVPYLSDLWCRNNTVELLGFSSCPEVTSPERQFKFCQLLCKSSEGL